MAEYSELLQMCDRVLGLSSSGTVRAFTAHQLMGELLIDRGTTTSQLLVSALKRLVNDDHISQNDSGTYIIGMVLEFTNNGGYKGQILIENELENKKTDLESLSKKSAQSVIDTNLSIQSLNNNTTTFYNKQTSFNNWQRGLTIAILLSSLIYTFVAYKQFRLEKSKQEPPQLQQLTDSIKSKMLNDSAFLKKMKGG